MASSTVAFVSDSRMEHHVPLDEEPHPECPARHTVIVDAMGKRGVLQRCMQLASRLSTAEEMLCVHSSEYVESMKRTMGASARVCSKYEKKFEFDVYVNGSTWEASMLSLGCSIEATRAVLSKRVDHALACVRPPGHHACRHKAMGFCFLNNAATCAKLASTELGVERVLIVDFDVHHGNGSQDMCYDDRKILYFSVHRGFESRSQWPRSKFYPGTGAPSEVGCKNRAPGFNVNVRWSEPGMGDSEYAECWRCVLEPIVREFDPKLVIVSAGFDAARGDPLGECDVSSSVRTLIPALIVIFAQVTPRGYFDMVRPLAAYPTVLLLEGGYNLDIIGDCFAACAAALLGDHDLSRLVNLPPDRAYADRGDCDPTAKADIRETVRAHVPYWRCFADEADEADLVCQMTGISLSPPSSKPQESVDDALTSPKPPNDKGQLDRSPHSYEAYPDPSNTHSKAAPAAAEAFLPPSPPQQRETLAQLPVTVVKSPDS